VLPKSIDILHLIYLHNFVNVPKVICINLLVDHGIIKITTFELVDIRKFAAFSFLV